MIPSAPSTSIKAVGHRAQVADHAAVEADHRISDQLSRTVKGDVAAARGAVQLDAAALELAGRDQHVLGPPPIARG